MSFFRREIASAGEVAEQLQVDVPDDEVEVMRGAFNEAVSSIRVSSETTSAHSRSFLGLTAVIYRGGKNALMVRVQAPDGDRSKLTWLNGLVVVLCREPDSREKPATLSSYMKEDTDPESRKTWGANFFGRFPVVVDAWGALGVELRVPEYHW